jgi:hypothetical protein
MTSVGCRYTVCRRDWGKEEARQGTRAQSLGSRSAGASTASPGEPSISPSRRTPTDARGPTTHGPGPENRRDGRSPTDVGIRVGISQIRRSAEQALEVMRRSSCLTAVLTATGARRSRRSETAPGCPPQVSDETAPLRRAHERLKPDRTVSKLSGTGAHEHRGPCRLVSHRHSGAAHSRPRSSSPGTGDACLARPADQRAPPLPV